MKRASEKRAQPRALAALAVMSVVLAGCDEALSPDNVSADAQSSEAQADGRTDLFPIPAGSPKDDVEAPEVFQLSEPGLWDGRPSLGGIWVAHPDVTQPERVRVKNTKNNKTVTAALFRRERNLPGPELQLSSAAAEKLGILAGAPTKVDVVALRRKAPEPEPVEEKPATEETPAEETQTATADEPNTDAAEIEVAETEQPEKLKWWQRKKPAAVAGGATVAAAATVAATDTATDTAAETATEAVETAAETEKPTKPKWWQRKKPAAATGAATAAADAATDAAAETTAEAAETVAEAEPSASLVDPEVTPPTEQPEKRKWWQKKKPDEITETPLDPIAGAAAAIDAAEPTPVSTAAATTASASAATGASVSSLSKPYIQIGTFGVETNANSAANKIRRNGMPAEVRELTSNGKKVWRVLIGPATTRSERNAMQRDAKDLGFGDAFTVKN